MRKIFAVALVLAVFAGCDSQEKRAREEPLLTAETFNWSAVPLSFQPPPEPWERQKHNEGGLLGIWFTHKGSVGERIYVSEYTKVGKRARVQRNKRPITLEDVVEDTRFSTAGWPIPADSFKVAPMLPDTVAGLPAFRVDFSLNMPDKALVGREYYFLHKDHLFEAAYLGLPVNLPLFERVVDSISFPPDQER